MGPGKESLNFGYEGAGFKRLGEELKIVSRSGCIPQQGMGDWDFCRVQQNAAGRQGTLDL